MNKLKARPQQKHEKVVSELLSGIFSGRLASSSKLPTEKQLSSDMRVDRTSLRTGLKQLESMHLLEIRQGDGIYVKDFMENAGIDALRALITLQDNDSDGQVIDQYLFEELWDFWTNFLPVIINAAAQKSSPMEIKSLMNIIEQEKNSLDDLDRIIELEMAQQDLLSKMTRNIIMILLCNSSRPLRKRMFEIIITSISKEELTQHINQKLLLLKALTQNNLENLNDELNNFRNILSQFHEKVKRTYWQN